MEHYYEDKSLVFKFEARVHEKVILYNKNYKYHIKIRHPEMNMKNIEEILKDPDYVYKPSTSSVIFYYEKNHEGDIYRVVIGKHKKHIKKVVTAYKVKDKDGYTRKHIYCVYDKGASIEYEEIQKELENDTEYFYEIFNIAK
jgi:hypothetical protein